MILPRLATALPLLAALLPACGAPAKTTPVAPPLDGLADLLHAQSVRYPMMQEEDLYKLIRQATHGPSHFFFGTSSEIEIGIDQEIDELAVPADPAEEDLVELLDPTQNLARVNLRPYLKSGGKAADLARAVAETAHRFRGDEATLRGSLAAAADQVDDLSLRFRGKDFRAFAAAMEAKGFPPGVHSEDYAKAYGPAYRIVQLHFLGDKDYRGRVVR